MKILSVAVMVFSIVLLVACSDSTKRIVHDDDLTNDALITDDATVTDDALVTDEAVTDEIATDEIATDEIATDEIVTDEVVTDELVTDEVATDEGVTDEILADEDAVAGEDDLLPDDDVVTGATCGEIAECVGACGGDSACMDACIAAGTPEAQEEFETLFTCVSTQCNVPCSQSQQACSECVNTLCHDEMVACYTVEDAPVYGTVAVNATFNYIYDGSADIQSQIQAHPQGVVMGSVFTGSYGTTNKPIPPTAVGATTISLAIHRPASGSDPAMVVAITRVWTSSGVVNPLINLAFRTDVIAPGVYSMDARESDGFVALTNETGPDTSCLLAISFGGSLTVTSAVSTDQPSGGSIAFNGSDILLYHPTETPVGDISDEGTCPKE